MEVMLIVVVLLLVSFGVALYFLDRYYRRQWKRVLVRAQKSELLKSVFIDNISHNLSTPLNAIKGYSEMILESQGANAHVKEMATNINDDTKKLMDFVTQLMELSKFDGGGTPSFTLIEVNLCELMASYRREALNITRPDVSVRVLTELSPHCRAKLDTNLMHQLMMHLLTNAAKHITQGDIIIKYEEKRKGLNVAVSYSGIGQSAMIGADVYSLLQKEDALAHANETSVLGFSICKAIVEILGGEFYMNTEQDKKTVAFFWFPCKMVDTHKDI